MTSFVRHPLESTGDSPKNPDESTCWISFGGNVGDVKATFDAALALLSLHCDIQLGRRSGLYRTMPMGTQAGSPFLNSICELTTRLSPRNLLRVLQSVENQLGRVRDVVWGPRTLDLDLINYGGHVVNEPDLIVPHPALTYRRFVLDPLVEIDADWKHPEFSESTGRIVERLSNRPLKVCLLDVSNEQVETLATQLRPKFPHLRFVSEASALAENAVFIRTMLSPPVCERTVVDLRRSPGDIHEQLTAAFTAIFDAPERISDW